MTRGDALGADLSCQSDKPLELDLGVAQAARNGCFPRLIALDERLHHPRFELPLEVDHVVRDTQKMRHGARIVDIVERAAPAAGVPLRVDAAPLTLQLRRPALVP